MKMNLFCQTSFLLFVTIRVKYCFVFSLQQKTVDSSEPAEARSETNRHDRPDLQTR